MSRKKVITLALCCVAVIAALLLAKGNFNQKCPAKECITIEASQEAKDSLQKQLANKTQTDEMFRKSLEPDAAIFKRTGKQILPKVEMKHTPEVFECKDENVYTISNPGYDKIVIYSHGGAFMYEISPNHVKFCDKLPDLLNAKVIMPLYPLAPQAKWRTTYAMLTEVYKEALKENKPVILMGDSAGAVLSLGLAMQIKEDKLPAPAKVVALSPSPDCTFTNKEIPTYEAKDPVFCKDTLALVLPLWVDKDEMANYHISPIYGDLKGLPDIMLFAGNCEIFYPDIVLLSDKLAAAGNKTKLVIGNNLAHVFPICTASTQEQSLAVIKQFVEGK